MYYRYRQDLERSTGVLALNIECVGFVLSVYISAL
jgi:hypothetical protein